MSNSHRAARQLELLLGRSLELGSYRGVPVNRENVVHISTVYYWHRKDGTIEIEVVPYRREENDSRSI